MARVLAGNAHWVHISLFGVNLWVIMIVALVWRSLLFIVGRHFVFLLGDFLKSHGHTQVCLKGRSVWDWDLVPLFSPCIGGRILPVILIRGGAISLGALGGDIPQIPKLKRGISEA